MTSNIKYSWFQNQKGCKRAKRALNKYHRKTSKLISIKEHSKTFGIELSVITINMIDEKLTFYYNQRNKLHHFITKWQIYGKPEALKMIERFYTKEELSKYKTDGGILKILRKIF